MSKSKILIIDDDIRIGRIISDVIEEYGLKAEIAFTGGQGIEKVKADSFDTILLDLRLPDRDGLDILNEILSLNNSLPVILISAHGDIKTAVQAVKSGAFDFLEKPISTERLMLTLKHALEQQRLKSQVLQLEGEAVARYHLLGNSPAMQHVLNLISKASRVDSNVLILGENGTGKELAARAIHIDSKRNGNPFVKINCAAIPDTLMESELFGYEKGAFTGASASKKGRLELADGGTVFLDEIGDMLPNTQAKLLRFLQEGELEKVGAASQKKVDVRVIAATNQNLEAAVRDRRFREDLYYRLNVILIRMPPLRERREDVPILAKSFLTEFCYKQGTIDKSFTEEALIYLANRDWPGNVRQLRNIIERTVVLSDRRMIETTDIEAALAMDLDLEEEKDKNRQGYREAKSDFERDYIIKKLEESGWIIHQAAKNLGIDRANLYRKMKKLGIAIPVKLKN